LLWSVEREKGHTYKDPATIINEADIHAAMEKTHAAAKDKAAIQAILDAAKERSFLTNYTPGKTAARTAAALTCWDCHGSPWRSLKPLQQRNHCLALECTTIASMSLTTTSITHT
jgi:hypothetical protein